MNNKFKNKLVRVLLVLLLVCSCLLVLSMAALFGQISGVIYYVSASEGNDANNGLSPDSPIKSLEKVSSLDLSAGDKVLFKCGDTFYGNITMNLSKGDKSNPIIFASYGQGKRPSLRYYEKKVEAGQGNYVMEFNEANGVEIRDLDIGCANSGIGIFYTTLGNEYVRVENCHFHDIYGVHQLYNNEDVYFSSAIVTTWKGELPEMDLWDYFKQEEFPLTGLYVNRCTAYDAGSLIGCCSGLAEMYVTNCVAEECGYYGAVVTSAGGYIDNCIFDRNGSRSMPVGSCGIMVSAEDFTIKNSVISNQQRKDNNPDGCGIDFEWDSKNVTVENVIFEGNAGVGVMFFTSGIEGKLGENKGTNYDCVIRNCKFVNNNLNVGNVGGYEIYCVEAGASGCVVENCEYIVDYKTKSETVDFYYLAGENDIKFENINLVEEKDGDYYPLLSNAGNGTIYVNSDGARTLWIVLGILVGLVIASVSSLILRMIRIRKKHKAND